MELKSKFDDILNWKGILFELFDKDGLKHPIFETTLTASNLKFISRVVWIDVASGLHVEVVGAESGNKKGAEKSAAHIAVLKVFRSSAHCLLRKAILSAIRTAAGSKLRSSFMTTLLSPLLVANDSQISVFEKAAECNTLFISMPRDDKVQIEAMVLSHFLASRPWKKAVILVPKVSLVEQRHEELSRSLVNIRIIGFSSENTKKLYKNERFRQNISDGEVFIMTPQMLIDCVLHRYLALNDVALLVFDDAERCQRKEPTHSVMKDLFNSCTEKPHILGFIANYSALGPAQIGSDVYYKYQLLHIASNMHSRVISFEGKPENKELELCHFDIHYFNENPKEYHSVLHDCLFSVKSLVASSSKMLKSTRKIISGVISNLEVLGLLFALRYLEIETNLHQSVMIKNEMQPYPEDYIFRRVERTLKDFLDKNHPDFCISPQVNDIIKRLLLYREQHGITIKALVLVEQRSLAIALSLAINNALIIAEKYSSEFALRAAYITGKRCSMSIKADGEYHNPKDILSCFRDGSINVIVTTSPYESFLNILQNTVVIQFRPTRTVSFLRKSIRNTLMTGQLTLMCLRDADLVVSQDLLTISKTDEVDFKNAHDEHGVERAGDEYPCSNIDGDDHDNSDDHDDGDGNDDGDGDVGDDEVSSSDEDEDNYELDDAYKSECLGEEGVDFFGTHFVDLFITRSTSVQTYSRYCKSINIDERKKMPSSFMFEKRLVASFFCDVNCKSELTIFEKEEKNEIEHTAEFRCSVQIVNDRKLQMIYGNWNRSEDEAKKSACFEACKMLYNIGVLNNIHLSPLCKLKSAKSLKTIPWNNVSDMTMFLYSFTHTLDPEAKFGFVSAMNLSEILMDNSDFEFFCDKEYHNLSTKFLKVKEFSLAELHILQDCYGTLISSTLTAENIEVFMSESKTMSPLLLVPLKVSLDNSGEVIECDLDWQEINRIYQETRLYRSSRSIRDDFNERGLSAIEEIQKERFVISDIARGKLQIKEILGINVNLDEILIDFFGKLKSDDHEDEEEEDEEKGKREFVDPLCNDQYDPKLDNSAKLGESILNGLGPEENIVNTALSREVYSIPKFIEVHEVHMRFLDICPDVPIILYKRLPSYKHLRYLRPLDNKIAFHEKRYMEKMQTHFKYDSNGQCRLQLATLSDLYGYLDRSLSAAKVHPIKLKMIRGLSPSMLLFAHIEESSIVIDCKNYLIPSFSDMKLLRTALTAPSCERQYSYERLETIGDSLLKVLATIYLLSKYPNYNEGLLTAKKSKLINNSYLQKQAIKSNLLQFVIANKIVHRRFLPMGYRPSSLKIDFCREDLGDKTISDVVESLIGSSYFDSNESLKSVWENVTSALKIFPEFTPYPDFSILKRSERNISLAQFQHIQDLEKLLKYTFNCPHLALEALSHPSFDKTGTFRSYQRLEFLGDSLLDFVITRYLYLFDLSLNPADLTNLRAFIVCNESLGIIAVRTGLYKYVLHNSDTLRVAMKNLELDSGKGLKNVSKVFGDIVESLIGAIFLDCDGDMNTVINFVTNFVIKDYFEPKVLEVANAGIPYHPVSVFYEVVASSGCSDIEISYDTDSSPLSSQRESSDNRISCCITIHGYSACIGHGSNRRIAKKQACQALLGAKNEERLNFFKQLRANCSCPKKVCRNQVVVDTTFC